MTEALAPAGTTAAMPAVKMMAKSRPSMVTALTISVDVGATLPLTYFVAQQACRCRGTRQAADEMVRAIALDDGMS